MGINLQLTREEITNPGNNVWTIKVDAVMTGGLDSNIFVYQALPPADPLAVNGDVFNRIATLEDMNELPLDAAIPLIDGDQQIPYYRVSSATFDTYSPDELARIWRIVVIDSKKLISDYKAARELEVVEVIDIS